MKSNNYNTFFIPCGLFFGLGIGMIFKEIPAGGLIGLAVGFLLYIIFNKIEAKRK
ncbi:hypothetical protein [Staphylococcus kloosii]|jgi:hypothetical protein|uniref:hypothetical protein n=1 Tax=Staphylococcus kloosii TaxID=29384 RepID=UPI000A7C5218|nr:hypothetical protein [Staphylococcus kloosii]MCD8879231.1 hypothetical protein [Staphylococcus kloosii]